MPNQNPVTRLNGLVRPRLDQQRTRHSPEGNRFCLRTADQIGFVRRALMPVIAVGLGTAGTTAVHAFVTQIKREVGRKPKCFDYLNVDTATREAEMDPADFRSLSIDGAGSDPHEGRRQFEKEYRQIRDALIAKCQCLTEVDDLMTCEFAPRQATAFCLFSGLGGGTSGGALPVAIPLVHDVAQHLHIAEPRIHLVSIGADMALRDVSRHPTPEQALVVPDTAANNLNKIFADFRNPSTVPFERPDGTSFPLRLSHAVWSLSVFNQSNGCVHFHTMADLIAMIAQSYLFLLFSDAGKYLEDRNRDDERLGPTQRA